MRRYGAVQLWSPTDLDIPRVGGDGADEGAGGVDADRVGHLMEVGHWAAVQLEQHGRTGNRREHKPLLVAVPGALPLAAVGDTGAE